MTKPGSKRLLAVREASFGYGEAVLTAVSLELCAGELAAVVGPNGGGKTTLLRGLLGLLEPLRGTVEADRSALGYVPQRESLDALYPLSALEVVEMGAFRRLGRFGGLSATDRASAAACLVRVGLEGAGRRPFSQLSGGQRQRVLIARALLMGPALLLLDEPTSGADPEAGERVLDLLRELAVERGLGVVLVTHAPELLGNRADVLWRVADGAVGVERCGRAAEVPG